MLNSVTLSYALRHHPEEFGLALDEHGWCDVKKLLKAFDINQERLDYLVETNTRFIFNKDKTKIKAAHGHSVKIKYENSEVPPKVLFHGTSYNLMSTIRKEGIKKMARTEVHLSTNKYDAERIARRHSSKIWVIKINTEAMLKDGYKFYKSEDNVWLTDDIKPKYILN